MHIEGMIVRAQVERAWANELPRLIHSSFGRVNLKMIWGAFNTLLIPEAGLMEQLNQILYGI